MVWALKCVSLCEMGKRIKIIMEGGKTMYLRTNKIEKEEENTVYCFIP